MSMAEKEYMEKTNDGDHNNETDETLNFAYDFSKLWQQSRTK